MYHLWMKTSNISVVSSNVNSQFVGAASEVEITHVADICCVKVQQFVTEQRFVTAQFHLTHLHIHICNHTA